MKRTYLQHSYKNVWYHQAHVDFIHLFIFYMHMNFVWKQISEYWILKSLFVVCTISDYYSTSEFFKYNLDMSVEPRNVNDTEM